VGSELFGYDLKPESLNAYEIGLGGHNQKLKYDAVFFYNDIKDMIAQTTRTYGATAAYTYENISDATTKGAEFMVGYDFTSDLSASISYALLKTKNNQTKKELEFQPENTIMANLSYKLLPSLNTSIYAKYIGEQNYTQTLNRGAPTQTTQDATTNPYTLVDLKVDFALSKALNIYGGINNIADEEIDDVLGSTVGRYYYAGVRAKF
jgi:outer membrane receptor for ferrienterochelin and colicins